MSLTTTAWIVIVVSGIVTFAIRSSFLLFADRFGEVSTGTREVLRMIPAAALAALVAPAVLRVDGQLQFVGPRPIAGAIALVVAYFTRSILWTIVVGILAVIGLEFVLS